MDKTLIVNGFVEGCLVKSTSVTDSCKVNISFRGSLAEEYMVYRSAGKSTDGFIEMVKDKHLGNLAMRMNEKVIQIGRLDEIGKFGCEW